MTTDDLDFAPDSNSDSNPDFDPDSDPDSGNIGGDCDCGCSCCCCDGGGRGATTRWRFLSLRAGRTLFQTRVLSFSPQMTSGSITDDSSPSKAFWRTDPANCSIRSPAWQIVNIYFIF